MTNYLGFICLVWVFFVSAHTYELTVMADDKIIEVENNSDEFVWVHCTTVMVKKKSTEQVKLEKVSCKFNGKNISIQDGSFYSKQRGKPCLFTEQECLSDGVCSEDNTIDFNFFAKKIDVLNEYCIVLNIKKSELPALKMGSLIIYFNLSGTGDIQLLESTKKPKE